MTAHHNKATIFAAVFNDDGNMIKARHERSEDDQNRQLGMDIVLTRIV
jgi:hypothetical protein